MTNRRARARTIKEGIEKLNGAPDGTKVCVCGRRVIPVETEACRLCRDEVIERGQTILQNDKLRTCPGCNGAGQLHLHRGLMESQTCMSCAGSGIVVNFSLRGE